MGHHVEVLSQDGPWESVLVGRERELAALRGQLAALLAGQGRLVLIGGEAGIGKTTLLEVLEREAVAQGALVLIGHCYDLAGASPYGAWAEILTAYQPPRDGPLAPKALTDAAQHHELPSQTARFQQVLDFFAEVAHHQPLVLLLEDVHWADPASLDLLRFLARHVHQHRLLLLATYRADELGRQHPLYQLLPHLVREGQAERVTLRRLDVGATGQLVRARYALAETDETQLVDFVQGLAEGNPFFIHELLHTLEEEHHLRETDGRWALDLPRDLQVPPLIQQVLDLRLLRLSEDVQGLLEMAAVIGQEVPIELWQAVGAEEAGTTLSQAIAQALEASLMVEAPEHGRLRFSHALVRETLYHRVVIPERQRLHRQVGEILSARPVPDVEAVAYHFQQAGDARAIEWLLRAGQRALELYAPRTAIDHLTEAISQSAQLAPVLPANAYHLRGRARATIGAFGEARQDYETALEMAHHAGDQRTQWEILLDLGLLWAERDYARTGECYRRALELAREMENPTILAHSLNRMGNWHLNVEEPGRAVNLHLEALAIFEESDDQHGLAETLDLLGMTQMVSGNLVKSVAYYQRAADTFRELGHRQGLSASLVNLLLDGGYYGTNTHVVATENEVDFAAAGEMAIRIAGEIGWRSGEAYGLMCQGAYLGMRGEYASALQALHQSLALAEEIEHRQWIVATAYELGRLYLDLLALRQAQRQLERSRVLATTIGSKLHFNIATGFLAQVYIAQGALVQAEQVLSTVLDQAAEPPTTLGERQSWWAQAELALARGAPQATLDIVDRLLSSAANRTPETIIPDLARLRGEALLASGELDEAEAELQAAHREAENLGYRPLLWRIDRALGRVYGAMGRPADAVACSASAREVIATLASGILDDDLRENFRRQAEATLPDLKQTATGNAVAELPGGLSPREIEVLRLVAQGLTDVQISEQLFISPRTVHGHLRSIYNKLGVSSRAAATRFAIEHRIL